MSSVGLVLGGGGVTGAAYEMAALMAIELATGWNPDQAKVVVGTSSGAYVSALVRTRKLTVDSLVLPDDDRQAVATRIREWLFPRQTGFAVTTWLRHGLMAGVRAPGLTFLLGSPARYHARGLAEWVRQQVGSVADGWPESPTVIVAYDVVSKARTAFGTVGAPNVNLAEAVAASSSIPLLFCPYQLDGGIYVDGGVVSGTHADLVLGNSEPLDLVLVLAPMAADEQRDGAWLHERMFDRVGRRSLEQELESVRRQWPHCEILVIRPDRHVLTSMRPNPMDTRAAVPTFIQTLVHMKRELAGSDVWPALEHHLMSQSAESPSHKTAAAG